MRDRLKAAPAEVPDRLDKLMEGLKASEKQVKALEGQLAVAKSQKLLAQASEAAGVRYLAASVADMTGDALRQAAESLQRELGSGIVSLVSTAGGKVSAVASVSDDLVAKGFKAGDVLSALMTRVGGKGSGRPNFAQGGGGTPDKVPSAIAEFGEMLKAVRQIVPKTYAYMNNHADAKSVANAVELKHFLHEPSHETTDRRNADDQQDQNIETRHRCGI